MSAATTTTTTTRTPMPSIAALEAAACKAAAAEAVGRKAAAAGTLSTSQTYRYGFEFTKIRDGIDDLVFRKLRGAETKVTHRFREPCLHIELCTPMSDATRALLPGHRLIGPGTWIHVNENCRHMLFVGFDAFAHEGMLVVEGRGVYLATEGEKSWRTIVREFDLFFDVDADDRVLMNAFLARSNK